MNSLLTILNERSFNNGKEVIQTPINSIVAATNSFPTEEALQAFLDRFLFRPTVDLLQKPISKRQIDEWSLGVSERPVVQSVLTSQDLIELQKQAENIKPSKKFAQVFGDAMDRIETSVLSISDRRRVQIIKFLRGYAVVKGHAELHPSILIETLPHICYQTQDDKEAIIECLESLIPTPERYISEVTNAANGIMAEFYAWSNKKFSTLQETNEVAGNVRRCWKNLNELQQKLTQLMDDDDTQIAESARLKMMKLHTQNETDLGRMIKTLDRLQTK